MTAFNILAYATGRAASGESTPADASAFVGARQFIDVTGSNIAQGIQLHVWIDHAPSQNGPWEVLAHHLLNSNVGRPEDPTCWPSDSKRPVVLSGFHSWLRVRWSATARESIDNKTGLVLALGVTGTALP